MGNLSSGQFVDSADIDPITFDTGDFCWSARRTKTGWLRCGVGDVSRATYADLFAEIVPLLGTFTVTLASPGVFTLTAHGLVIADRVYLTTTGALPTGLAVNTIYYVVSTPTADTFTLSATEGGSATNTTGSQSGVHSSRLCSYGLGDGTTTFGVPDAPGRSLVAAAGASGHVSVRALGQSDGVALADRSPEHNSSVTASLTHSASVLTEEGGAFVNAGGGYGPQAQVLSVTVGPGGTLAVDQPANLVANLFIKT